MWGNAKWTFWIPTPENDNGNYQMKETSSADAYSMVWTLGVMHRVPRPGLVSNICSINELQCCDELLSSAWSLASLLHTLHSQHCTQQASRQHGATTGYLTNSTDSLTESVHYSHNYRHVSLNKTSFNRIDNMPQLMSMTSHHHHQRLSSHPLFWQLSSAAKTNLETGV